ncbi:MAG TPA: glycosyltransferase [Terriglobia bacterium]|nr:glycosyltransferase [Terriglobia bacterium]
MTTPIAAADSADRWYTFSVFTATYNRRHTLHRVYDSLRRQTFRDFEWLIIDDGSRDRTEELVRCWQAEASFSIRYLWQENQGLNMAFNRAVREAKGELFLQFDSDNACVPEALERFKQHWDAIPDAERPQFSGVEVLCVDQNGRSIGTRFPKDVTDSNYMEIRYRYKVKGEKWGFQRTNILQNFPFPTLRGYIPEGLVWAAIARKFKTRFVNEELLTYWSDESDHSDRLSKLGKPAQNAPGLALWHQSVLNDHIEWFSCLPEHFLRSAAHFSRFSFHLGIGMRRQAASLTNFHAKVLWALMLPLGLAVHRRDLR